MRHRKTGIMSENICFEFLQVAIGSRKTLSVGVTNTDWHRLFDFCKRQALVGVGFSAVERLYQQGVKCPVPLKMKWMASTFLIEKRNGKLNRQCRELTEQYEHDGLRCCILKGQGNLLNYLEHLKLRRNPGDIDIWCAAPNEGLSIALQIGNDSTEYRTYHGRRAVREFVMMQYRIAGNKGKLDIRYHHIEVPDINGIPVEVHFRIGHINSPLRNMRMQRWFDGQADVCMTNKTLLGFNVPTPFVNVVYQMTHLFTHYFDEGLGLRQLLDYYFALQAFKTNLKLSAKVDEESLNFNCEVMRVLRSFGMGKFAAAVMWVLHEVFAMTEQYYICTPNEKEGRKMLAEIMQGGNFGQYDERGKEMKRGGTIPHALWKLKRVMRLVGSYPEEALCEPFFRVWHLGWRVLH